VDGVSVQLPNQLTARQAEFLRLLTTGLITGPYRSCARVARETGYSESVARKPQIIFESAVVRRVWRQWMEIYFPLDEVQ
jgi:hypothetical protein